MPIGFGNKTDDILASPVSRALQRRQQGMGGIPMLSQVSGSAPMPMPPQAPPPASMLEGGVGRPSPTKSPAPTPTSPMSGSVDVLKTILDAFNKTIGQLIPKQPAVPSPERAGEVFDNPDFPTGQVPMPPGMGRGYPMPMPQPPMQGNPVPMPQPPMQGNPVPMPQRQIQGQMGKTIGPV